MSNLEETSHTPNESFYTILAHFESKFFSDGPFDHLGLRTHAFGLVQGVFKVLKCSLLLTHLISSSWIFLRILIGKSNVKIKPLEFKVCWRRSGIIIWVCRVYSQSFILLILLKFLYVLYAAFSSSWIYFFVVLPKKSTAFKTKITWLSGRKATREIENQRTIVLIPIHAHTPMQ